MKGLSAKENKAKGSTSVATNVFTISKPMFYFAKLWGLWPQTLQVHLLVLISSLIFMLIKVLTPCRDLSLVLSLHHSSGFVSFYRFMFTWKLFSQLTGSGIQTYTHEIMTSNDVTLNLELF